MVIFFLYFKWALETILDCDVLSIEVFLHYIVYDGRGRHHSFKD